MSKKAGIARSVMRYSEAFKLQVLRELETGRWESREAAARAWEILKKERWEAVNGVAETGAQGGRKGIARLCRHAGMSRQNYYAARRLRQRRGSTQAGITEWWRNEPVAGPSVSAILDLGFTLRPSRKEPGRRRGSQP
jgi:transposase-like protein